MGQDQLSHQQCRSVIICVSFSMSQSADLLKGFCHDSAIHKMDEDKFDIIMKIHNYVPFRMTRALSAHWMDSATRDMPKSVINVSSTSGLHGSMGQINYATAKAGIVGLTKTIASEWGRLVCWRCPQVEMLTPIRFQV